MPLVAAREAYRRAELQLRELLFGDTVYSGGRLRGEESRQKANVALRRMRAAFDELAQELEQNASRANLAEDLLDEARREAPGSTAERG